MAILKTFQLGLVLGGGGARGLAHIGIIKVLEKAGIPIDVIGGASMGALIGGIYAQNPDASALEQSVTRFIKGSRFKELGVNNLRRKSELEPSDILQTLTHRVKRRLVINLAANRIALLKADRLRIAVQELLQDDFIENCRIPFICVATDLNRGTEVIFDKGRIQPAVEGSSAIPGFVPPLKHNGRHLIDGSVINNFPVESVRKKGATSTIAVDVSLDFEPVFDIDNVIDLVMRTAQISANQLNKLSSQKADFVIAPDIGDVHWSEFNRIDELISKGCEAAEAVIDDVLKLIQKRKRIVHRLGK